MAEFQEVMRQKERMCNSILCYKCDIWRLCDDDSSLCQRFMSNNPKKAEEVIMSWAAECPELVYPTWREWLQEQGVLDVEYIPAESKTTTTSKSCVQTVKTFAPFYRPIPADIAQKLGIEPKER